MKTPGPPASVMSVVHDLRSDWRWGTFGEVLSKIESGKSFQCDERPPRDNEIGIIKVSAVTWGIYNEEESKTCFSDSSFREGYLVKPGDFLFSRANTLDLIGACVLVRQTQKRLMLSDKILRFHFDGVLPEFALWYLRGPEGRAEIQRLSTGNQESMRNIGQERIRLIRFPMVNIDSQRLIVAQLEARLSHLDRAVADLKSVKAKLVRHRASVLAAATSGTLVPTEAELARREGRSYEPANFILDRILKERRARWEADQLATFRAKGKVPSDDKWKAKYQPPVAPDTTNLPELPEGWAWASVDQLISGLTSGSRDWSKYYGTGTGTFIMAQNIRPGRLDMTFRQPVNPPKDSPDCRRSQVEPGDLLLTIVGANTGDLCMVKEPLPEHYVCQSVALIRPVIASISKWLLTWFLSKTAGRKQFEILMYGAARPHLSFTDLLRCIVALPPEPECARITDRINVFQSDLDHFAESARRSKDKAATLRSAILQAAFQPPQITTGASHGYC